MQVCRCAADKQRWEKDRRQRLTGRIRARSSTVPQQDLYELQADVGGLEADLHQHRLDVGRVHAAVRRHEQRGAGLQQVGSGGCGAGHHGLQVAGVGQTVVKETQPSDAVQEQDALEAAGPPEVSTQSAFGTWFWTPGPQMVKRGC